MTFWKRLAAMFKPVQRPPVSVTVNDTWTPEAVEARIELAGRAEVFDEARRLGWTSYNPAPLWVWGAIANDVLAKKAPAEARVLH